MKISHAAILSNGWVRFTLNVGGFAIKWCQWHQGRGCIFFPKRSDMRGRPHRVIFVHGRQVKQLRAMLESGQYEAPRDRRPCTLRVYALGKSREVVERLSRDRTWFIFKFTVRGFTIMDCRWHPHTGSIQLPVTFQYDDKQYRWVKKRVVCAYGAHILRLRNALELDCYGYLLKHAEPIDAPEAAVEAGAPLLAVE